MDKVSAIHSVYFNYKDESPENIEVGVIARDVEKVLPEVVSENDEGYKSVDYSKLTPLLIEAVKELKAEINKKKTLSPKASADHRKFPNTQG